MFGFGGLESLVSGLRGFSFLANGFRIYGLPPDRTEE